MAKTRSTTPVLDDVARVAGVAPITVSRVVNGHPSVSEATRTRVLAAIESVGYRANMAARTLAGGRSRILGVIAMEPTFFGPAQTLLAIDAAAASAGYSVTLATVRSPSLAEMRAALDRLSYAHVEGIVVVAPVHAADAALQQLETDLPVVVTSASETGRPVVAIDQATGARLVTEHLLGLGHGTVHHVSGPVGWYDAEARITGWRDALRAAGRRVPRTISGDWSAASGHRAGGRLAGRGEVTAVFVANDQMALGVLRAFRQAGRRVPDEVSVVGFDASPESEFFEPPLTTVRQDFGALGRRCVETLLARSEDRDDPDGAPIVPQLVVRSSSAPPA